MENQKRKAYFEKLKEHCASITAEYSLVEHDDGNYTMRSVFTTTQGGGGVCHFETELVPMREDAILLEVEVVPDIDLNPQYQGEIEAAILNMNYFMPVGYLGIYYSGQQMFYRYTGLLDTSKSAEELVRETGVVYELIANVLGALYPAFEQINEGNLTYREAVEKKMLLEQN